MSSYLWIPQQFVNKTSDYVLDTLSSFLYSLLLKFRTLIYCEALIPEELVRIEGVNQEFINVKYDEFVKFNKNPFIMKILDPV